MARLLISACALGKHGSGDGARDLANLVFAVTSAIFSRSISSSLLLARACRKSRSASVLAISAFTAEVESQDQGCTLNRTAHRRGTVRNELTTFGLSQEYVSSEAHLLFVSLQLFSLLL